MRARVPWQLAAGITVVAAWLILGFAAPLLTPVNPLRDRTFVQDGSRFIPAPFEPGTYGFPLGSDRMGHDLWVQLMYGAQATFVLAFAVLAARFIVGVALGALAGWFAGRWIDRLVSSLIDAFSAFPMVLFAVLWIFAFDIRSGISAFALALAITGWWGFGRATRASVLALKDRPFVEAARATGLSELALFLRHAVPNLLPILAVTSALEASAILLVLGELGFLGFVVGGGTNIPLEDRGGATVFVFSTPEWGAILAQGRFEVFRAPWIAVFPALAFASAVLAFNLAGYGLRTLFDRAPVALGRLLSRRVLAVAAAAIVAFHFVTPFVGPAAGFAEIARTFDAERARSHIAFLADPARGGRMSGSAGYDEAAAYVAEQFRQIGLEPLGDDGSYFQRFSMSLVELGAMPTLERIGAGAKRYVPRADFSEQVGGRRGGGTADGKVVFVGGGIRTADYSDYEGTHPEGNVVLIAGPTQGDPIDAAIREGAVGAIFVSDRIIKPSYIPAFEKDTLPTIVVTEAVADELIAASGKHIADLRQTLVDRRRRAQTHPSLQRIVPEPLSFDTDTRVRFSVPLGPVRQVRTANVAGLLRGADPDRARRAVLVGGHLDGVGTDPDGTVYPAANDNASGPGVTIEIARTLAAHRDRLRNSVIFVAFAGEEEGLVGSEQFLNRSLVTPWRPDNIVSYFNTDVIACCGPQLAASEESFALHARLAAAADRLGIDFGYVGGSSDHATYNRRRVPAVIIAWNDFGPFHTTADTIDTIEVWRVRAGGEVVTQAVLELAGSD